jgi:hypothetical protein
MAETFMQTTRLLTDKSDLGRTRLDSVEAPSARGEGDVVLKVDKFSLTTNNITYAAFGDAMNYWSFFPTGVDGFGQMPVWGFADVVESQADDLAVGARFYGYFPIAERVLMRAERVTPRGFYDGSEHRRALVSAYNQYTRCSTDPAYRPELEELQALYRPLFLTSFMLADFLEDNGFFGARRVLFSSASSKTTYGTAFCLMGKPGIETVGLTSARNADFVRGLGCYTSVLPYGDVTWLDAAVPTVYVDFSGDGALRARIHQHLDTGLVYDCYAGSSANPEFFREQDLPGPKPEFYFAPNQIRKRNADWGPAVVTQRYNEAQTRFFGHVTRASPPWVKIETARGFDGAAKVIAELAGSGGDPATGHIVRLG